MKNNCAWHLVQMFELTHGGLMIPYGNIDLDQDYLR